MTIHQTASDELEHCGCIEFATALELRRREETEE